MAITVGNRTTMNAWIQFTHCLSLKDDLLCEVEMIEHRLGEDGILKANKKEQSPATNQFCTCHIHLVFIL